MPDKARTTWLWIAAQQGQAVAREFAMPTLCPACGFAADNVGDAGFG
jgi:hypothetical protein